jgi:hypothetical protein
MKDRRSGWRTLGRVISAMVAVVVAGLVGVVGLPSQPAHAQLFPGTTVFVQATFNISATFNFGGDNGQILRAIEQAKREIIAEINASEQRILQHIDNTEAARIAGCIRTASANLRNLSNFPTRPERNSIAVHASGCADDAGELSRTVATPSVVDYLGYAMAEINAIATVLRASAGLDLESQLTGYTGDYAQLLNRLRPTCSARVFENERWVEREWTCTAYNGDVARAWDRRNVNEPREWIIGPVDLGALSARAAVNTSWPLAREALPVLHQALRLVQRDFVVAAVGDFLVGDELRLGQTKFWHEDGPLFWNNLGNPGTATAITAAIYRDDRRQYFAVIDGKLWNRYRNRDESWGPWLPWDIGATAVSAAADPSGGAHVSAIINGQVHHRAKNSAAVWTDFQPVPGRPGAATAVASTVDPSGRLHLVSIVDGQVGHQLRHTDGSWTGGSWGIPASAVSAAAQADGQVHVAAVRDGQVFHRLRIGEGVWTDFAPVTGLPAGAWVTGVTSAIDPAGNYQLAVIADLGTFPTVFVRTRFPNGGWSPEWMRMGTDEDMFLSIAAIAAS